MNLRLRSALLFTVIVAFILLICYSVIFTLYSDFKKDEFFLRLEQKALTTYKLLIDVQEVDNDLLKLIDKNTLNELYDEKVLVFNDRYQLIYSSIDDHAVSYSDSLLKMVEQKGLLQFSVDDREVVGIFMNEHNKKGIVIASATDNFGKRKLQNLLYILIISYIAALLFTALVSYFYVKQVFIPLDLVNEQMNRITENRLNERVEVTNNKDEIGQLATNFNKMLDRLQVSFQVQKSFIQHASHELRTPLANLVASCEAALNRDLSIDAYKALVQSLHEEHKNLVSLTNALLMLSKYENMNEHIAWPAVRIDEVLFQTIEETQELFPDQHILFDYNAMPEAESLLESRGQHILLKTAFSNLMRNACLYGNGEDIRVQLSVQQSYTSIAVSNTGTLIDDKDIKYLFEPFFRGDNSIHKKGYGLGLAIAHRILQLHQATLTYHSDKVNTINTFEVKFPHVTT
jgi:two-component system, OmpR family, sensor histidine kinase ArlS